MFETFIESIFPFFVISGATNNNLVFPTGTSSSSTQNLAKSENDEVITLSNDDDEEDDLGLTKIELNANNVHQQKKSAGKQPDESINTNEINAIVPEQPEVCLPQYEYDQNNNNSNIGRVGRGKSNELHDVSHHKLTTSYACEERVGAEPKTTFQPNIKRKTPHQKFDIESQRIQRVEYLDDSDDDDDSNINVNFENRIESDPNANSVSSSSDEYRLIFPD